MFIYLIAVVYIHMHWLAFQCTFALLLKKWQNESNTLCHVRKTSVRSLCHYGTGNITDYNIFYWWSIITWPNNFHPIFNAFMVLFTYTWTDWITDSEHLQFLTHTWLDSFAMQMESLTCIQILLCFKSVTMGNIQPDFYRGLIEHAWLTSKKYNIEDSTFWITKLSADSLKNSEVAIIEEWSRIPPE